MKTTLVCPSQGAAALDASDVIANVTTSMMLE